tara:strand:- start:170 stop:505 length:336 start_codon:yes stop_codon:yes gene_type:complete
MNSQELKANDEYHLGILKNTTNWYMWKDLGNIYDVTPRRTFKPKTLKGFVELVDICSKNFARIFIECPDVIENGGERRGRGKMRTDLLEKVWDLSKNHLSTKQEKRNAKKK